MVLVFAGQISCDLRISGEIFSFDDTQSGLLKLTQIEIPLALISDEFDQHSLNTSGLKLQNLEILFPLDKVLQV